MLNFCLNLATMIRTIRMIQGRFDIGRHYRHEIYIGHDLVFVKQIFVHVYDHTFRTDLQFSGGFQNSRLCVVKASELSGLKFISNYVLFGLRIM